MAHFAKLNENNIVTEVFVVNNDVLLKTDDTESEYKGKVFLNGLFGNATWVQTSYNATFRNKFAAIGDTYDETNDVFISPKPYDSWTLDSNFDWQAPTELTDSTKPYTWNENTLSWDVVPPPPQPYPSWTWSDEFYSWEPPVDYPLDSGTIPYRWNEETQTWDLITE